MRISHISWNLVGLSLPLLVAAAAVPQLISSLGHERFGLLALAWGLIGYAGALDLGIGRATTQLVAKLKASDQSEHIQIPTVLTTAVRITLLAGGFGALIILCAALFNIGTLIKVENVEYFEIKISILLLALALPMQAVSATYKGVNEAYLNFKEISILRVFLGMANFGVPFLVSIYSTKMYWLVGSLVISRGIALYAYRFLANKCIANLFTLNNIHYNFQIGKNLFKFGGWFTLSSVLNPAIAISDRLIISTTLSAAAVSTYVLPYEMVVQSLIVIGAVTTVAFPYFSQMRIKDPQKIKYHFYKILSLSVFAMIFVVGAYNVVGDLIIAKWLGNKSVEQLFPVMRVLSFGLIPYTIGTICISLLHAYGKTALTAKLNLIEFPIFLAIIYLFIHQFGIIGAAYAWILRISLDALILLILSTKCK